MQGKRKAPAAPRRVLVIDVGGSHVKFRVGAHGPIEEFISGPSMGPTYMTRRIVRLTRATPYDCVSIGYPGLVYRDRVAAEPRNLGKGWTGFDFARALGKPVRIINDAAMQAIGSYSGGRMLFLGLGTGLGATLIIDGVVEPTELGHMPYRRGRSFEEWVGERASERLGNRKWRKAVNEVVADLQAAFAIGLHRARRRQRAPPEEAAAAVSGSGTTATPSSAGCGCGSAARRRCPPPPQRARRRRARDDGSSGRPGTTPDLVQQRQGDRRLRARLIAAVVHHRRRHHQRGLLPAHRHSADPRPRLHRRRRCRLLGRGEAHVAARAWSSPPPASRRPRIVHRHERFELTLRVAPCEHRDVLLIEVSLRGDATLNPTRCSRRTSAATGNDNQAAVCAYRGRRVLWAAQGPFALALAAADAQQRDAWGRASAGFVGDSDGWQDFARHGALSWQYDSAGPGNVALIGELPRQAVLALGFGSSTESAATLAYTALSEPFAAILGAAAAVVDALARRPAPSKKSWSQGYRGVRCAGAISTMVLRAHQDKTYPGAMVASLSVPWGNTREERAGYHLVWPRDLVESAGALLALGAAREARNTLRYLSPPSTPTGTGTRTSGWAARATGSACSSTRPPFRCCSPSRSTSAQALAGTEVSDMIQRALSFLVRQGPVSEQDRWEEDAGLNTFTLAVCIAALVAGARYLPAGRPRAGTRVCRLLECAPRGLDRGTRHPAGAGTAVAGYYVRVAPAQVISRRARPARPGRADSQPAGGPAPAGQRPGEHRLPAVGSLRPAQRDDPLITRERQGRRCTAEGRHALGPCWHRYNGDGYGEHDDGSAFDGTGRGRPWPLLTGERGTTSCAPATIRCRSSMPWRAWLPPAGCCRSRSGTPLPSRRADSCRAGPPGPPCRWCGRTPNT